MLFCLASKTCLSEGWRPSQTDVKGQGKELLVGGPGLALQASLVQQRALISHGSVRSILSRA
jgi:hypothetical protein